MKQSSYVCIMCVAAIMAVALLAASTCSARIIIDGAFEDWESIAPSYSDSIGDQITGSIDLGHIKIADDDRFVYIYFEIGTEILMQQDNSISMYLDTDKNPSTGTPINGIGADLIWHFGARTGEIRQGSSMRTLYHEYLGFSCLPVMTSSRFEVILDRSLHPFDITLFPGSSFDLVFADMGSGRDIAPDEGSILTYTFETNPQEPYDVIPFARPAKSDFRMLTMNVLKDQMFEPERKEYFTRLFQVVRPDIFCFQEIYNYTGKETAKFIESILPSTENQTWYSRLISPDIIIISRFPIKSQIAVDGNGAFLLETASLFGKDLVIIDMHLPFGDNAEDRQMEVDHIMAFLRDMKSTGGYFKIEPGVPVIITGDSNFVGESQNLKTMLEGDIINEMYQPSFSPDWDDTNLTDASPRQTHMPQSFTWYDPYSTYWPGRLDYIIYTDSVLSVARSFVLFTEAIPEADLAAENLQKSDSTNAADHLITAADFIINRTPPKKLCVDLQLNQTMFVAGDTFRLTAAISNPGPDLIAQPFVVLLSIGDVLLWYPEWSSEFSYQPIQQSAGVENYSILEFMWPDHCGSASGIIVYGALLDETMTSIQGEWDSESFGWDCP